MQRASKHGKTGGMTNRLQKAGSTRLDVALGFIERCAREPDIKAVIDDF